MRSLKPWHVKRVALGGVYHPRDNPDFMYVVVRIERNQVHFLMLLSNSSMREVQVGCVAQSTLDSFNKSLVAGEILRCA